MYSIILIRMSSDKEETKKLYMKEYYAANKEKMVKQIMTRQKLLKNSDVFIEQTRDKIIEELHSDDATYPIEQICSMPLYVDLFCSEGAYRHGS